MLHHPAPMEGKLILRIAKLIVFILIFAALTTIAIIDIVIGFHYQEDSCQNAYHGSFGDLDTAHWLIGAGFADVGMLILLSFVTYAFKKDIETGDWLLFALLFAWVGFRLLWFVLGIWIIATGDKDCLTSSNPIAVMLIMTECISMVMVLTVSHVRKIMPDGSYSIIDEVKELVG